MVERSSRGTLGFVFAAVLTGASPSAAGQEYPACGRQPLTEARSLESLPAQVKALLGRGRAGLDGIADRNGKFNVADVVDNRLPMRRFVLAGFNERCALVAVERGGRGHWFEVLAFERADGKWQAKERWSVHPAPDSLQELHLHVHK